MAHRIEGADHPLDPMTYRIEGIGRPRRRISRLTDMGPRFQPPRGGSTARQPREVALSVSLEQSQVLAIASAAA